MKTINFLTLFLLSLLYTVESFGQLKAGTLIRKKVVSEKDSIEFYETDYATRQKSYMNLLVGTWSITTMKKQSQLEADNLAGIMLTLNKDSTFSGLAGCNRIWGRFSIKGTSIKFNELASTKKTCAKQEEENWILKLLQETVSRYSVTKPLLLLRDGSSNIVFEAKQKNL